MNNIFIAIITLATLMVYNQTVAQNNCDLDVIVPVRTADYEINDTLPDLTPPDDTILEIEELEGPRMIYFIHGLNGNEESWAQAETAITNGNASMDFPGRFALTMAIDYSERQQDLENALTRALSELTVSGDVHENYRNYWGIAFGHSQGGIVGRFLDEYWSQRNAMGEPRNPESRKFGGLVTLATPNQGAQILNNEEYIHGIIRDLADNLSAGPVEEFRSSSKFFVRLMAKKIQLGDMRDSLVNFMGKEFASAVIKNQMPGITNDYTVPGPTGKGQTSKIPFLNEYQPKVRKASGLDERTDLVAFYAVGDLLKTYYGLSYNDIVGWNGDSYLSIPIREDIMVNEVIIPISWGTIHFQLNSPNDEAMFEADTEDWMTSYKMHQTKHHYESKELRAETRRKRHKSKIKWYNPASPYRRYHMKKAEKRRDAWNQGVVFLSKFDELYRIVIGARYHETETITTSELVCECTNGFMTIEYPADHCDTGNGSPNFDLMDWDCGIVVKQTTKHISVWRNKDSDGVVLVESQREIPQNTWAPRKLEGVTHMQVRNSSHTAEMLQTVFEGGVGDFFRTEVK